MLTQLSTITAVVIVRFLQQDLQVAGQTQDLAKVVVLS